MFVHYIYDYLQKSVYFEQNTVKFQTAKLVLVYTMSTIYRDYLAHYIVEINQVSFTKSYKFSFYRQMNEENVKFLGF